MITVSQARKGVGECGGNLSLSIYCLLDSVLTVLYALTYPILKVPIIAPFYKSNLSKAPTTKCQR